MISFISGHEAAYLAGVLTAPILSALIGVAVAYVNKLLPKA